MNLREFVLLAKTYDGTQNVPAWFMSDKLDGWRALWDGGITRGMPTTQVPWANNDKKGHLLVSPVATGLWSRYGNVVYAPASFLDRLPKFPLDGELWMGPNTFQKVVSVTKRHEAGPEWDKVQYRVFDAPSYREWLQDGEVRNKANYMKVFKSFMDFAIKRMKDVGSFEIVPRTHINGGRNFEETLDLLNTYCFARPIYVHEQVRLPFNVGLAKAAVEEGLAAALDRGNEGIILRMGRSFWVPKRVAQMLKYKPYHDAEGIVIGYVWGKETALGSKHLGRMGSIILDWEGKRFKLAGFEDEERVMTTMEGNRVDAYVIGCDNPGELVPATIHNPMFPRGCKVTFKYRELTDEKLPKEARLLRVRPDE